MSKKIFLLGSGGHASVLADITIQQKKTIEALVGPNEAVLPNFLKNIETYKDEEVLEMEPSEILLLNGVGSIPGNYLRYKLHTLFEGKGFKFKTLISDSSIVSEYATIGEGVQILHGAIVQAGSVIGKNTIINSGAIIEHDCVIGEHNHIAPGATLSGQVKTNDNVHIGTGANLIQLIEVGKNCVVGAGVTLTKNLEPNKIAFPPRAMIKSITKSNYNE